MSSVDAPNVLTSTQKTLIRSWWKKATATNPRADSFRNIKTPIGERSIFGTALSESIKYAHSSISYIDNHLGVQCFGIIPTIIAKCGSYLKEEGLTTEGIFRLAGSAKRIGMLQQIFETPDQYGLQFDWIGYTVHDAASVMRRFLNHLPEPVITLDYYRPFKDTMAMSFASTEAKIEAFQTLIECLPLANQYLLLYILDMLGIFSRTCKVTRMDTACLAAVFAPGILSHPNDALSPAGYKESQLVLEFLIEHQERFTMPRSRIALVENSVLPRNPSTIACNNQPMPLSRSASTRSAKSINATLDGSNIDISNFPLPPQTPPNLYTSSPASRSVTNMMTFMDSNPPTTPGLRRSKTTPNKRNRFGERETQQVIYVNRNASQDGKKVGRWKSIRRLPTEIDTL